MGYECIFVPKFNPIIESQGFQKSQGLNIISRKLKCKWVYKQYLKLLNS